LTLETATFFAATFRATCFGAAFFALAASFGFAALFLVAVVRAALRADVLAVTALLALGLEGAFALTARFALFAVGFAFERDADRLKPFVRLLLMCGNLKRLLTRSEQPRIARTLAHRVPLYQWRQVFAGAFKFPIHLTISSNVQTKKNT
jgi:hypothetical protein